MAQAAQRIADLLSVDRHAESAALPAVSDLTYRGLRHWGLTQVRLQRLAPRPPALQVQALLSVAWAALQEELRAPHVVVSEAVTAAKKQANPATANFVNALLRKTLADPAASQRDTEHPIAKWNAPTWWIEKIRKAYPADAEQIRQALTSRAPLTLRLSTDPARRAQTEQQLAAAAIEWISVGPQAIVLTSPLPVEQIPGFSTGLVSVQDAAAQWAGTLFDLPVNGLADAPAAAAGSGAQILDACAAPGGKSIALAQRYPGTVWAMDASAVRLKRLQADLPRAAPQLIAHIELVVADVLQPGSWPASLSNQMFDAILLDAPCSASGVVRRHPEIPWRRSAQDIAQAAKTQAAMLDVLWSRLKPGGELVFVTCSLFPEEGELQEQRFLQRTPDAVLLASPGRILPQSRILQGVDQDGFYYAKFKKNDTHHATLPVGSDPRPI
jgi:16S rRNA (cytosine967-C5)-methyltransferase